MKICNSFSMNTIRIYEILTSTADSIERSDSRKEISLQISTSSWIARDSGFERTIFLGNLDIKSFYAIHFNHTELQEAAVACLEYIHRQTSADNVANRSPWGTFTIFSFCRFNGTFNDPDFTNILALGILPRLAYYRVTSNHHNLLSVRPANGLGL